MKQKRSGSLGAGGEAAKGIEAADDTQGAPGKDEVGSEPLSRDREHKGGYGGEGGHPRTSSDAREAPHEP